MAVIDMRSAMRVTAYVQSRYERPLPRHTVPSIADKTCDAALAGLDVVVTGGRLCNDNS